MALISFHKIKKAVIPVNNVENQVVNNAMKKAGLCKTH